MFKKKISDDKYKIENQAFAFALLLYTKYVILKN